jgi:hypothetical protein
MIKHILKASIERDITISIMYQKGSEITQRNIKVLEIDDSGIKAFCYLRNQRRVFKLANILSASFVNNVEKIAK